MTTLTSVPATFVVSTTTTISTPPVVQAATVTFAIPAGTYLSATWGLNNALWSLLSVGGGNTINATIGVSDTVQLGGYRNGTARHTDTPAVTAAQLVDINAAAGGLLTVVVGPLSAAAGTNQHDSVTVDASASFTLTLNGCTYAIAPSSASYGAAGGSGTFGLTTTSGCPWSAVASDTWLHTSSTGTGNGTVSYTVDANGGAMRSATITVGVQAFTVTQTACSYSLSPTSAHYGAAGGSGTFGVTTDSSCAWTAISQVSWLHTVSTGTGNGTVSYTVDVNLGFARTGTITVEGMIFTVTQDAAAPSVTILTNAQVLADHSNSLYAHIKFTAGYVQGVNLWSVFGAPIVTSFVDVRPMGWATGAVVNGVLVLYDPATGLELASGSSAVTGAEVWLLEEGTQ